MNQYCTVGFVINMTNIMSMTVTIIPRGIPLRDTHLMLMILIKVSIREQDNLKIGSIINQLSKDYPPQTQKAIAYNTRSQSSLDSVQITRKSSKELKDLAQQLLLQLEKLESEERVSPASSEVSVNRNPVDPFQDFQDPYDGYNLDSD